VIESNTAVRIREDVVWREIEGEIVLLDLAGSMYYTVTASGAFLWPHLIAGSTPAALVDLLASRFSLDQGSAQRDVSAFLEALTAQGLLVGVSEANAP
jgi:hypothetical protein